jgi:hypothetical protein
MCSSADAPFPLQVDAFSCRIAPDFNSRSSEIANVHALITSIGGCATADLPVLRLYFAVAKLGNGSYSRKTLMT